MPVAPYRQNRRDGYAKFGDRTVFDEIYAHRIMASLVHGPIPEGYEVDHLCFTRNCVNPLHLAVVPLAHNRHFKWQRDGRKNPALEAEGTIRRLREARESPVCKRGHLWSENERINSQGRRVCAECLREAGRKHDAKRRAKT